MCNTSVLSTFVKKRLKIIVKKARKHLEVKKKFVPLHSPKRKIVSHEMILEKVVKKVFKKKLRKHLEC